MKKPQPSPAPQAVKPAITGSRNFLLSLIIPCYNESKRVGIMMDRLAEFEEKWKGAYEVIIVDDGSKDDTVEKINEALSSKYAALKDKVRVEKMPANGGKGSALKMGVSLAHGDYILTLDTDMSTQPLELINWERKEKGLFSGDDTIYIGSRKHDEGKVDALKSRKFIGGVFNTVVQVFTSLQLKDTQCGFKLYPGSVAKMLFGNMQSKGWAHDVEVLYQADLNGYKIVEMPISWVNQPESKVNVVKDSMMMFIGVLAISLRIWLYNTFVLPFRMPEALTAAQRKLIWYKALFNVMALLLVIVMPMMSFQYAITGDEHWHFDYGNDIYNYFFHGDTTAQTATSGIQYYGGLFDFITAATYHLFHFWDHYTTMHFINALVGAIGIIYAGKLAKLLGGWQTALLTMILLVLSPSWFGHNFANPKDIPFSVGYTAGIYYILLFLQSLPRPGFKQILGLVLSIGWAMGVRIGGLLLIAYLVLFLICFAVFTKQIKAVVNRRIMLQVFAVGVSGYCIALICWPYAHLNVIDKPLEALKIMSNFFINIGLLYDGKKIMSNQIPWFYIPKYIWYTAPLTVLAGFAIGLASIPVLFRKNKQLLLFALFVLFSCLFPVAYAIYKKSSLYDGWRHFLFIYPPMVVLTSLGWTWLMNSKQAVVKYAAVLLVIAGLVSPVRFAVANHRFESLYYNEIAGGLKNIYGKYETDYYMLGIKPATEWLLANEHLQDKKVVISTNCVNPLLAYLYLGHYKTEPYRYERPYEQLYERTSQFVQDPNQEALNKEYAAQYPGFIKDTFPVSCNYVKTPSLYSKDWDYCILFSRDADPSQLASGNWPPPETIHVVTVDGVPIAAILKRKTKKELAGFELLKAKKGEEAKAAFLASLSEYPDNPLVWQALTEIYNAEGKPDSAIYAGYKALEHYPGDINVYEVMGNAFLKQQKADSAIMLYKRLAKYNESYSHFFLGYTYATMGKAKDAFAEIDASIDADPYNQQPYMLGMQLAQQIKDQGKAEDYNDRAKKMFPEEEGK